MSSGGVAGGGRAGGFTYLCSPVDAGLSLIEYLDNMDLLIYAEEAAPYVSRRLVQPDQ